jgi:GntR family transcriptional regulator, transcriptional repressor for pyruvate dehydrogenase complex
VLRKRVIRRTTLPKAIADHLTSEIRSGRLRPGERLPTEKVLMGEFGVGRSTIREALQHLVILGLAEAKQGFGYKIKSFDRQTALGLDTTTALLAEDALLDLLEAREIVEVPIARLAATRATKDDLQSMERLLRHMEDRLLRGQTVHRLAARFHLLIAQAAKNATLQRWITSIIPLLTARGWQMEHEILGRSGRELTLHRELYERIRGRDPNAVERAMVEHLADTRATILQHQESLSGRGGPRVRARSDR